MEASPQEIFPVQRYMCHNGFPYYHPYSETLPEDFLHCVHGVKEPNILVLGSSDLLSCFHTLWKNFKSGVTKEFDGVHFVLNDSSSAVIARDLLILYSCLKMPEEISAIKKWISAIWAIWYSHELLPEHRQVLYDSIDNLIALSKSSTTWSSTDNPLNKIVRFTSSNTVSTLRDRWIYWRELDVSPRSMHRMHAARITDQRKHMPDIDRISMGVVVATLCTALMSTIDDDLQTRMKHEATEYYKTGVSFAEDVLSDTADSTARDKTTLNTTFFERKDGKYNMYFALVPYKAFDHDILFSKRHLTSLTVSKSTTDHLLVSNTHFTSHPMLSNSVQQFAMWLRSSAVTLKQASASQPAYPVTFTFHCSDTLDFCIRLQTPSLVKSLDCQTVFDVVYSSDLIDSFAPPNLVLCVLPIMKPGSLLFTILRQYKCMTETVEDYLRLVFGMDVDLLPVMFGVRCHNHEGKKYTSGVCVQHEPYDYTHVSVSNQWKKQLIWEKLNCLPLKHPSLLEKYDVITTNLCSAVCNAISPLITCTSGHTTLNNISIDTAMLILHSFSSRVEGSINNHEFWKPLVSLILKKKEIRPHRECVQVQALLHGIHFHLTVTEDTCPICLAVPITQYLTQIRIPVAATLLPMSPSFLIYIHRGLEGFEQAANLQHMATLNRLAAQVMDSVNGVMGEDKLTLDFFVPRHYVRDKYNVTIISYVLARVLNRDVEVPTIVAVEPLTKHAISSLTYTFPSTLSVDPTPITELGSLSINVGDMKSFETVVTANETEIPFLDSLSPHRESPHEVHISVRSHKYVITYPYPVDYDKLSIKLSRKQKTITVLASRMTYAFEIEKPMYVFNTSDEFNHLLLPMSKTTMLTFNGMQFSQPEREVLKTGLSTSVLQAATICCKESLNFFFQCQDEHYFNLAFSESNIQAMVVVQERVFDLQNRSPVVDLAYCFLDRSFVTTVALKWQLLAPLGSTRCIAVDENELKLFKKVFSFFAKRTVGHSLSKAGGRFQELKRHKIDQYFTRAAVYPLYADPESYAKSIENEKVQLSDSESLSGSDEKALKKVTKTTEDKEVTETTKESKRHCTNCGIKVSDMKRCADCGKVKYCSRECQKKHWKIHKADCKKFQNYTPSCSANNLEGQVTIKEQCDFCTKQFSKLKQCGACGKARYCSEDCQKKDWKEHKKACRRVKETANTESNSTLTKCGGCEKIFPNLRPCPCHKIAYCSRLCQRMDWMRHKIDCTANKNY